MAAIPHYDETITIPRAVKFPLELLLPENFDPRRLETWPNVVGRLEYSEGKLLYMPPCGDLQQTTTADIVIALGIWQRTHAGFVLGTNEAGMHLRGATRAADAAIWRRSDTGEYTGGLRRAPPVLAVEVAGPNDGDTEGLLRAKANWYLGVGVTAVWLVFPESRDVLVVNGGGESRYRGAQQLPALPGLPDLGPGAHDFFRQIDGRA